MPARLAIRFDRLIIRSGPTPRPPVDGSVQILRGVACLLLVAFHAVGSSAASGLHVPNASYYREFTNLFVHVRMPLFTFLSGLVYAFRPLRPGDARGFLGKKLQRLGIPLVIASTIFYTLHLVMHDPVQPLSEIWRIYLYPFWHLWFVQALLGVFGAIVVLESAGALSTFPRFLGVMALSLGLYWAGSLWPSDLLGLRNATYLLPFFLWGLGVHRFRRLLQSEPALLAAVACFAVAQGFHAYLVLSRTLAPIDPVATRSAWTLVIGMSAGLCGLRLLPRVPVLERIGASSYVIYLYHPLFASAVLIGLGALHAVPTSLLFLGAAAAGIAGPMVIELVAARVPLGGLLLEGRSRRSGSAPIKKEEEGERELQVA